MTPQLAFLDFLFCYNSWGDGVYMWDEDLAWINKVWVMHRFNLRPTQTQNGTADIHKSTQLHRPQFTKNQVRVCMTSSTPAGLCISDKSSNIMKADNDGSSAVWRHFTLVYPKTLTETYNVQVYSWTLLVLKIYSPRIYTFLCLIVSL